MERKKHLGYVHKNLESAVKYGEYLKSGKQKEPEKEKEEKLIIDAPAKKSSKKNYVVSKETQEYTKRSEAPACYDDDNVRKWFETLAERAKNAKGKWSNSSQYKEFYENCKEICEIVDMYNLMRTMHSTLYYANELDEDNALRKKIFNSNCDENGTLTIAKIEELYQKSWKKLQNSAAAYVEFKIDREGFTRDASKKPGHALRSKSVEKFGLMDEIFGHKERKAPQKDNQIKM